MALEITFVGESQVTYTKSYHKIVSTNIDNEKRTAQILIVIYKDEATRDADENAIIWYKGSRFVKVNVNDKNDFARYFDDSAMSPTGKNPRERSYEYLKTQDPDDVNYSGDCPFDYKNDSKDVIE